MNDVTGFALGSLLVLCIGLGCLCAYLAKLLADANKLLASTSESTLLASKASNANQLAEALTSRDQAKADIQALQKELNASSVPDALRPQMHPDTMVIGGIPLGPLRR
jgi:hypothetical protein